MAGPEGDVPLSEESTKVMLLDKHVSFISGYGQQHDTEYDLVMSQFLRISGVYWGLTALDLMHASDRLDHSEVLAFVLSCQTDCGGFAPYPEHDAHLLYTLSAVQVLAQLDALDHPDVKIDQICAYVQSLQQPDGSFFGDCWGEVDTRFSFCAVACLSLLKRLHLIDVHKAVEFVCKCSNFDGGFGSRPGSESHAGQIYCCLGFLSITKQLHRVDADLLGWWLAERQLKSGGLNGRPEKLPDVCYSWWVLASLAMLGRLHWVDAKGLTEFILSSQDKETGGISDRPGDIPDPFHTLFGVAGLSLLGHDPRLKKVHPVFCMPQDVIDRLGVKVQLLQM